MPLMRIRRVLACSVRIRFLLAFLLVPALSAECRQTASHEAGRRELTGGLDSLVMLPQLRQAHVGIRVFSLEDSSLLYDYQGSKLFPPASALKLITSSAALTLLPPGAAFTTTALGRTGPDSIVRGELYIRGSGDPLFSTGDLDSLVLQLANRGIRQIDGDLVGDISLLDTTSWGTGWMWDDEPGGYQPFLRPLALNRNCVSVAVSPSRVEGNPARISLVESVPFVRLVNLTRTTSDTSYPPLRFVRDRMTNDITISGRVDPLDEPDTTTISIASPDLFFLRCLKERLHAAGISVGGDVRLDTVSTGSPLASIGHDVRSVLPLVNKESDNFAAEQVMLAISRYAGDRPAKTAGGIRRILHWLSLFGIDTSGLAIADGSGLSSYSMMSPEQFIRVLAHMYTSKDQFEEFFNSLSIAGVDGTLARRMRGTGAEGRVRAKTGTVTGSSGLAGYAISADGKPIAFAIMSTMYPGKAKPVKRFEDAVVELITRSTIGGTK
jgi:D-alanyl-D-alanine carboxypeptidase/D-alanyl-D-alanine-endopeptidase (penicillin-binding protein 4)